MTEAAMGSPLDTFIPTQNTRFTRTTSDTELKPRIKFVSGCEAGLKWIQSITVSIPSKPARTPTYDECLAAVPDNVCLRTIVAMKNPVYATSRMTGDKTIFVIDLYRRLDTPAS